MKTTKVTHREHILKPTIYKIVLTTVLTLLVLFAWVWLLQRPELRLFDVILFFILTLVWIIISGILSSIFVFFTSRDRLTRVTSYVFLSLLFVIMYTIIYALF